MIVKPTTRFKKDLKLVRKRGRDLDKLTKVLETLAAGGQLEASHLNHPLEGEYGGFMECHIENDWLLIYQIDKAEDTLYLTRTGTHSDLF